MLLGTSNEKKIRGGGFETAGEIGCLCSLWILITRAVPSLSLPENQELTLMMEVNQNQSVTCLLFHPKTEGMGKSEWNFTGNPNTGDWNQRMIKPKRRQVYSYARLSNY